MRYEKVVIVGQIQDGGTERGLTCINSTIAEAMSAYAEMASVFEFTPSNVRVISVQIK